jgi:hypothetical protein
MSLYGMGEMYLKGGARGKPARDQRSEVRVQRYSSRLSVTGLQSELGWQPGMPALQRWRAVVPRRDELCLVPKLMGRRGSHPFKAALRTLWE